MTRRGAGLRDPGRRQFLKVGAAAAAGVLLPAGCRADRRPNLLLILTDDQAFDAIGYASGSSVITPNLDRLASQGAIFDAGYCNAMPCTPSRGCLMSGLHWHRWAPLEKTAAYNLEPGEWTWARALRRAGYATALVGKMHFRPMRADHGFQWAEYCEHQFSRVVASGASPMDDYEQWMAARGLQDPHATMRLWPHDPETHPVSWVRDRAIHYLREVSREPFSLTVSFRHPHPPFDPVPSFARLYDPRSIEIPTDHWLDMKNHPSRLEVFDGEGFYPRESKARWFLKRRFAYYFALVTQVDQAVGEIVKHVDLAKTLVIFTSDHGVYLGRRGRIGKHPLIPFDAVARIPLFACGHGVPAGARIANPVGLIDLAPTFLRAAGIGVPGDLDGEPLQRYFADPSYGGERALFSWGINGFNMVRRGSYKYFRSHPNGHGGPATEEMLFDLARDPGELDNRASDGSLEPTRKQLARAIDAVESRPPATLPRFAMA